MSSTMNNSNVAEMSESQFKDSLDALIAGELDDPNSRLASMPSSGASTCSSMAFTSEALHQHESQPIYQQQSTMTEFQLTGSRQVSQLSMNMMDGAGAAFPPNIIISGQFPQTGMPQSSLSSSYAGSLDPVSDATSSRRKTRGSAGSKRKKAELTLSSGTVEVSEAEDGSGRIMRKVERNIREQRRSQQIVDQIANLRDLLASSNVQTKADKYSTLVTAAKYIKQLQDRSTYLENEQKKLLVTIGQATDLVNNKYVPVASNAEAAESVSLDPSSASSKTDVGDEDDSHAFVSGLDYRDVFLACPVAGAITSIDGRFLDCNEDFEELTGYTKDELFRNPSESPPYEPSERHMSVFNVLKREDMERLFAVMSDMLRKPASENQLGCSTKDADRWSDTVSLNRKDNVQVTLNMKLVRQKNGLPRFFSCSLLPTL